METIDQLQKWGWFLFAMALLIPVLCTAYEPPTYIPKSQHPYKWLMGQWCQVLKSWIKKAGKDISNWRATWQHQQVLQCSHAIAHKHSTHCTHIQLQAILALQVLVLMAIAACSQDQVPKTHFQINQRVYEGGQEHTVSKLAQFW